MLEMALCDERLVALTSREVGVKLGRGFGWRFFRTNDHGKNSDCEDEISISNVFVLSFWGSLIIQPFFQRPQVLSMKSKCRETPSRACPIELPLWCVRFCRSICSMPNWQGNSTLTMTPLRCFLNPSCKSNKTAEHSKTPGVSVDTGS